MFVEKNHLCVCVSARLLWLHTLVAVFYLVLTLALLKRFASGIPKDVRCKVVKYIATADAHEQAHSDKQTNKHTHTTTHTPYTHTCTCTPIAVHFYGMYVNVLQTRHVLLVYYPFCKNKRSPNKGTSKVSFGKEMKAWIENERVGKTNVKDMYLCYDVVELEQVYQLR